MINLTFVHRPFGTGFIQDIVLRGTVREAKDISLRHIQGFLMPRMQETIEEILKVARKKQKDEEKKKLP